MECPICFINQATYVINCGSTVDHKVCDQCEVTMRMKEPATRDGRILKCPYCRVPEKTTGKRSTFSYEYELAKMYEPVVREPIRPARARTSWQNFADAVRAMPRTEQLRYIRMYPPLASYLENFNPPQVRREPVIHLHHSFCQSGRRETGECPTRGKTERKCIHPGCDKFVCRSCRQCLTH